jgi:hypothetical protein
MVVSVRQCGAGTGEKSIVSLSTTIRGNKLSGSGNRTAHLYKHHQELIVARRSLRNETGKGEMNRRESSVNHNARQHDPQIPNGQSGGQSNGNPIILQNEEAGNTGNILADEANMTNGRSFGRPFCCNSI